MSETGPSPDEQLAKESQGIAIANEITTLRQNAKTDTDYELILKKAKELKELFGIAGTEVKPEQARELLGTDFLGVEAINKVFGIELKPEDIPHIPFSKEDLEQAKKLNQFLILRTDKIPADKLGLPNTKQKLEEAPETRWALVTKDLIPNSTNKNYLQQTEELIKYVEELFKDKIIDKEVPSEYQEAIKEFNDQKEELRPLAESTDAAIWVPAAERLANLQITQLTRSNRDDILYDFEVYKQTNNVYLLPDKWTWTSSRASDGYLVNVGSFSADGAPVNRLRPGRRYDSLGVSFSRSL